MYEGKGVFVSPRSKIILPVETLFDCAVDLMPLYKMEDKWLVSTSHGLIPSHPPEVMELEHDPVKFGFVELKGVVSEGLYLNPPTDSEIPRNTNNMGGWFGSSSTNVVVSNAANGKAEAKVDIPVPLWEIVVICIVVVLGVYIAKKMCKHYANQYCDERIQRARTLERLDNVYKREKENKKTVKILCILCFRVGDGK
jgi:hypothetical protein